MSRRSARKNAFFLLFQMDFNEAAEFEQVKEIFFAEKEEPVEEGDKAFILSEVEGTREHMAEIDALIEQYGEDLYMFNNPDGYYIIRGNRWEAFEDAAFSLDVGEFSEVVETEAGFSILMRYEKEELPQNRFAKQINEVDTL